MHVVCITLQASGSRSLSVASSSSLGNVLTAGAQTINVSAIPGQSSVASSSPLLARTLVGIPSGASLNSGGVTPLNAGEHTPHHIHHHHHHPPHTSPLHSTTNTTTTTHLIHPMDPPHTPSHHQTTPPSPAHWSLPLRAMPPLSHSDNFYVKEPPKPLSVSTFIIIEINK